MIRLARDSWANLADSQSEMSEKLFSGEAMLASLKPYPRMKDSGVEWLGEVPEHWGVRRLRNVADVRFSNVDKHSKDQEKAVRLCNYSDVYHNDRIRSDMDFMRATATHEEVSRFGLAVGDVLITKDSETWDDIGVPAVVESTVPSLVCGYHLALIRPKAGTACGKFLRAALSSPRVATQLHVCANGVTRFGLSQNAIKSAWLPAPPLPEQTLSARFLDHATSHIERYIRAKEKLIALLEEQKRVIVHDAVTGRIDVRTGQPYAEYKPSGVKWLGEVPATWMMSTIKAEFECLNHRRLPLSGNERGAMTSRQYDYYGASGVIDKVEGYLFDDDLLLIAEDGANLVLRNLPLAIIARGKFWVNNHAHILKPRGGRLEYLAELMESLDYLPWISGAAQPKLTQDRLMSITIAVPKRDEQDVIASYLLEQTEHICISIARAQREIELLHEYRTRLIADVVTGKLDVRAASARLSHDADAPIQAADDGGPVVD